jgi:hypothetical protein
MEKVLVVDPMQFVYLMFGFAGTVVTIWTVFWISVVKRGVDPHAIVRDGGFLRVVTVGFTLSAVVILSIARVLSGELAGAIISGVGGYVLGSIRDSRNLDQQLAHPSPPPGHVPEA